MRIVGLEVQVGIAHKNHKGLLVALARECGGAESGAFLHGAFPGSGLGGLRPDALHDGLAVHRGEEACCGVVARGRGGRAERRRLHHAVGRLLGEIKEAALLHEGIAVFGKEVVGEFISAKTHKDRGAVFLMTFHEAGLRRDSQRVRDKNGHSGHQSGCEKQPFGIEMHKIREVLGKQW